MVTLASRPYELIRFTGMTKFAAAAHESPLLTEINITPFTDVLLVLLIIFMLLAALLTPPGFERQLSNPGRSTAATISQRVIVTIDPLGSIAIFIRSKAKRIASRSSLSLTVTISWT